MVVHDNKILYVFNLLGWYTDVIFFFFLDILFFLFLFFFFILQGRISVSVGFQTTTMYVEFDASKWAPVTRQSDATRMAIFALPSELSTTDGRVYE